MGYKEEYLLSEYQDLGLLNANKDVHIVRNKENGLICVKKTVPLENRDIYLFLKKNPSHYMPHIFECMEMEDSLVPVSYTHLPAHQVAYTGMDALTHAIEAYVSTLNCAYTDPLACLLYTSSRNVCCCDCSYYYQSCFNYRKIIFAWFTEGKPEGV